jgi:HEAT repeat protein
MNLAKQFLGDASLEVQREAVRSASKWPVDKSGAVLFLAIESPSYQTRKDAATRLADCWPEAAGFPIDAPAPRRAELLADLQTKWNQQFSNVDQAAIAAAAKPTVSKISPQQVQEISALVDRLADRRASPADQAPAIDSLMAMGEELPPLLDAMLAEENRPLPPQIYRDVLPHCGKEFEYIQQMTDGSLTVRRAAVAALSKQSEGKILPIVAIARVKELLLSETDPVMWLQAFKIVDHDPRESAALLAAAALSHPAPEVRRRACAYFATYPDPARTESLVAALSDKNVSVLHAALQALAESSRPADVSPVEELLAHPDHALHLDAALALARWHVESGRAALERMAADDDPQLRRKTVQAIGKLGDPVLIATLIKQLDDQQDVRRAALISLCTLTGQDTSPNSTVGVQSASYAAPGDSEGSSATLAEQAEKWKDWYTRQNRQQ